MKFIQPLRLALIDRRSPRGSVDRNRQNVLRSLIRPVAPLVGAWIEICEIIFLERILEVAPLVGAWIEILLDIIPIIVIIVAPLVGAWIEIPFADTIEKFSKLSLPSWERGLK